MSFTLCRLSSRFILLSVRSGIVIYFHFGKIALRTLSVFAPIHCPDKQFAHAKFTLSTHFQIKASSVGVGTER